jgi:hypothetical protein
VVEWLTLLLRIREVPVSNFGPDVGHPEWALMSISTVSPGKFWGSSRPRPFPSISFAFHHSLIIPHYTLYSLSHWKTVFKKTANKKIPLVNFDFAPNFVTVYGLGLHLKQVSTPVPFIPDDGGSTHLWNVGRQSFYTAVHPRRQIWTSYLPPWELEISQSFNSIRTATNCSGTATITEVALTAQRAECLQLLRQYLQVVLQYKRWHYWHMHDV